MNPKTRKRQTTPSRKRPVTRFSPQFVTLEDRATPATFYVDNAFAGAANGDIVTFNNGLPGQKAGLVFGTDAFATFNDGLTKANGAAGDDTLRIGNGAYDIDNALGPVDVTDSVSIIGSGNGVTQLLPTTDAGDQGVSPYGGTAFALLRISVAGKSLNVSDVILDGGAFSVFNPANPGGIGSFLRYENGSSGTVNRVSSSYSQVFDNVDVLNEGVAIVATDAGTNVTVSNSTFTDYGFAAVAFQLGATGAVSGSSFTGSGAFEITEYGVIVSEGSNATVSGSFFRDHTGSFVPDPLFPLDKVTSAGVFVQSYNPNTDTFDKSTNATIIGNTFTANVTGIIVGSEDSFGNLDTKANAVIQHNNITGNELAIDSSVDAGTTVNALYNWWGDVTGPFATGNTTPAGNNLTSTGNPVDSRVLWRDASIAPNQGILQGKTPVLSATSAADYRSQLTRAGVTVTAVTPSPTNVSPLSFKVQFTEPVSAFSLADITFTTAVGGVAAVLDSASNPVGVNTTDSVYFVSVTGMAGTGNVSVDVPASTVGGDTLPTIRTALFGGTAAAGAKATILFDNVAPTIAASSPTGFPVVTGTSPAGFTLTFSEPVTGFDKNDLVLSGTALRGNEVVTVTPSDATGTVFSVSIANLSKRGTVNVNAAAGAATDAAGNASAAFAATPAINFVPPFSLGFAAGGEVGIAQPYFGVDENFATKTGIVPFETTYTGGVRVASADINNDGTLDIIAASGVGRRTEIRVFDGSTTAELGRREIFEAGFTAGLFVAAGDFNNDGVADVVVSSDVGGSSRVSIFDGKTFLANKGGAGTVTLSNFFAIEGDPGFFGGVRVAAGDVNNDGRADLVVGAGFGGGPRIAAFNGATLGAVGGPKLFGDYFAFSPSDATTLRNGVFVGVGDVNGDGFGDIVAGAGEGGGPRVETFSGKAMVQTGTKVTLTNFFAATVSGTENNRGGSRVAAVRDINNDGRADIIVAPGRTGGALVGVFFSSNPNLVPGGTGVLAADRTLNLFGNFVDGVFVG